MRIIAFDHYVTQCMRRNGKAGKGGLAGLSWVRMVQQGGPSPHGLSLRQRYCRYAALAAHGEDGWRAQRRRAFQLSITCCFTWCSLR